jgi:hypothetical protein
MPSIRVELDHDDLSFTSSNVVREFAITSGSGGTLRIKWEVDRASSSPDRAAYIGTFEYFPNGGAGRAKVSCYTVGVQGRRLGVELMKMPTGTNVALFEPNSQGMGEWQPVSDFRFPLPIPKTGFVRGSARKYPPDERNIWGIAFDAGTPCVVKVKSKRNLHSPIDWLKDSHDTSPPPDEPGGQDGEEE